MYGQKPVGFSPSNRLARETLWRSPSTLSRAAADTATLTTDRNMARPKKDITLRRTVRLELRLTPEEEQTLLARAAERGMTMSDLLRSTALSTRPRVTRANPERAALIRGLAELGKLGSNVNQIARAINRQQAAGDRMDVAPEVVANALHGVHTLSSHLLKHLSDGH